MDSNGCAQGLGAQEVENLVACNRFVCTQKRLSKNVVVKGAVSWCWTGPFHRRRCTNAISAQVETEGKKFQQGPSLLNRLGAGCHWLGAGQKMVEYFG